MDVFMVRGPASTRTWRCLSVRFLMALLVLQFCSVPISWANPKCPNVKHSGQIWNFDTETEGTPPQNFVVGTTLDGRPAGEWKVIDMNNSLDLLHDLDRRERARITKVLQALEAPSPPHVLAQLKNHAFELDYNVILIQGTTAAEFDLSVSFLPVVGKADMGGGLIWRAQDHHNYYITRANPLEQNVRFYRVVNGVRHKLANFDYIISVNTWHTIRVRARDSHFQIIFDEQMVLDIRDNTFQSGQIGLWTKADAVTFFDDLQLSIVK